jgi:large subunit ribosomal protein LP1
MSEAAVSYAAIILADAEVEITAEKLLALTQAAGIEEVEPVSETGRVWRYGLIGQTSNW